MSKKLDFIIQKKFKHGCKNSKNSLFGYMKEPEKGNNHFRNNAIRMLVETTDRFRVLFAS